MANRLKLIFSKPAFFLTLLILLTAVPALAVRAGLDYTCIVYDGAQSREMTCDMCSYAYSDRRTFFSTYEVNAKEGYVVIVFQLNDKENKFNSSRIPLSSPGTEFEVDYFWMTKVMEGQTVRLKGTDFGFKLIDAFGFGCPEGAQC
jgi:hypothetical protein